MGKIAIAKFLRYFGTSLFSLNHPTLHGKQSCKVARLSMSSWLKVFGKGYAHIWGKWRNNKTQHSTTQQK